MFNEKTPYRLMLKFIKQDFVVSFRSLARPTLIDSNSTELHYYPFMVTLDRRNGSSNTLDDLPKRICDPNETKAAKV